MKNTMVALISMLWMLFTVTTAGAQETTTTKVNWLTWDQAMDLYKKEKKKIMLDVYTDWCKWCEQMDKETFQQPAIAKYLNENYYPVRFDAEQKQSLKFKGKEYKFVKNAGNRGYHELAAELLNGKLSYPSVVFLDADLNLIQTIHGFRSPEEFEQIITYFGKNFHMTTPWSSYTKTYKSYLISNKH